MISDRWCKTLPNQPRIWSPSSLRTYMECPRKHQLSAIYGWSSPDASMDRDFGVFLHAAMESYKRTRASGHSHEDATTNALGYILFSTVEELPDGTLKFWGGQYVETWRCSDPGPPFKSGPRKGQPNDRLRCGLAKQDNLVTDRTYENCPQCGSICTSKRAYVPVDRYKNRETLVRSILWWCDEMAGTGGIRPIVFPSGELAVEVPFQLPLPINSPDGTQYEIRGVLDEIGTVVGETAPVDHKTTKQGLTKQYFERYEPDLQIDTYDLATNVLFGDTLHPTGIIIAAMQTALDFSRFAHHVVVVPEERREETLTELTYWIKKAEADAKADYFPKNTAACNSHGRMCEFAKICRLAPSSREAFLRSNYVKRK